jgi:hypothetical protein
LAWWSRSCDPSLATGLGNKRRNKWRFILGNLWLRSRNQGDKSNFVYWEVISWKANEKTQLNGSQCRK